LPAVKDPVPPEIGWVWDTPELVLDRLVAADRVGARVA
jgi:hypothetical protein